MSELSWRDAREKVLEWTEFRWELLRRNPKYRKEYDQGFKKLLTKKELEMLKFPERDESDDDETWQRKTERWKKMQKEYKGTLVTKDDMKAIRRMKAGDQINYTNVNLASGHGVIVVFCERWGIRYPKDYRKDFDYRKDETLFWGNRTATLQSYGSPSGFIFPVPTTSFNSNDYELYAKGALDALKEVRFFVEELKYSFEKAIEEVTENFRAWNEYGRIRRERGESLLIINERFGSELILAYIGSLLQFRRQGRKRNKLDLSKNWRLRIMAWDLYQKEGTYAKVSEVMENEKGVKLDLKSRNIGNWCNYIQEMIDSLSPSEGIRNI